MMYKLGVAPMQWSTVTAVNNVTGAVQIHIIPVDDHHEHLLGGHCWCGATLDSESSDDVPVYIHHSADCREDFECGMPTSLI